MTRSLFTAVAATTVLGATALFASLPANDAGQCCTEGSTATTLDALLESPTTAPSTQPAGVIHKVDVDQFDQHRGDANAVILDVRTPKEFEAGHLPGAINLSVTDDTFDAEVAKLDKRKTYLVHCKTGKRSDVAVHKMQTLGFETLYDLTGGYVAWTKAKKPVETGSPTTKPAQ